MPPLTATRHGPGAATPDDAALQRARQGDLRAWAWCVRRDQELVSRVAFLLTDDTGRAEQVASSTFIRAFRGLRDLPADALLRPWLLRLALGVARPLRREMDREDRERTRVERPAFPRLPASRWYPEAAARSLTPPVREAVDGAFDGLPTADRLVIASRYLLGLTPGETAALLDLDVDAIPGRLAEALATLRSRVSDARVASAPPGHLATWALMTATADLVSTPDLADAVVDRLQRDAIAYPEQLAIASSTPSGRAAPAAAMRRAPRDGMTPFGPRSRTVSALATALALAVLLVVVGLTPGLGWVPRADPGQPDAGDLEAGAPITAVAGGRAADTDAEGVVDPAAALPARAVAGVDLSIASGRTVAPSGGRVPVRVAWANDPAPVVSRPRELQRRASTGRWSTLASIDDGGSIVTSILPDRPYAFRLRGVDPDGSAVAGDPTRVRLAVLDSSSRRLRGPGSGTSPVRGAIGGGVLDIGPGETVRLGFSGRAVALVATRLAPGATLRVRLDGGAWQARPLEDGRAALRRVVFSEPLDGGRHTLEVAAAGAPLALDAVLILR